MTALATDPALTCTSCAERAAAATPPPAPTPIPPPAPNGGAPAGETTGRWSGPVAVEGRVTGEMPRRVFKANSLYWDLSPTLPLSIVFAASEGHANSIVVGQIDSLTRGKGGSIDARGDFDLASPDGAEAARLVTEGRMTGVSIMADDVELEVWVAKTLLAEMEAQVGLLAAAGDPLPSQADYEVVAKMSPDDEIHVVTSARIRGVSIVETPALAEARIAMDAPSGPAAPAGGGGGMMPDGTSPCSCTEGDPDFNPDCMCGPPAAEVLIAAAHAIVIPDVPPADWFQEPTEVPEIGAITVTDAGRLWGYLAPAGVAHRAFRAQRIEVPSGNVDYAAWMNRPTIVAGGTRIATGPITMGCGHASLDATGQAARDHHDNSCSIVATARIGENRRGVWIAGALVHDVTPSMVARMLACQLSGDWRPHPERPGMREFAGALLVPVPGFPMVASAAPVSLHISTLGLVASAVPVRWESGAAVPETPEKGTAATSGQDASRLAARVRFSRTAMSLRHRT